MPGAPVISILLPVFDAAATLPLCLRSIGRQSETRWECIVMDDGSTDSSLDCARAFAALDPRFRIFAGPHRGLVATLDAGLSRCRGRFVARMDADDVMHRRRLEAQHAALERAPDLAAVGCHVRIFPERSLGDGMRAYERWLCSIDSPGRVREEAFVECPVAHPTLMIRSDVLARFGYRDRGWPEDYDLVLRLLESGHELDVVPHRLLAWRHGPTRLSRTDAAYGIESFTACKASFLARSFLADSEGYVLWGYGGTGKALQKALRRHGKHPTAIVELHPGRLGEIIQGAPVIPPAALVDHAAAPIVVSVAGATARGEIRADLARMGFRETVDYVCAA